MGNKKIKVLFLNADTGDYLNISLLHGLHNTPNVEVYDYPKSEVSYANNRERLQKHVRGNGFTLFFNSEDLNVNRFHLLYEELKNGFFDLVIFGDIQASFGLYVQLLPILNQNRVIVLDGSDAPNLFGYSGVFWRNPAYWLIPKPHKRYLYYKRELTSETYSSRYYKLLPKAAVRFVPRLKYLRPISFSIPQEKIVTTLPEKTKTFAKHIVDDEVAIRIHGASATYAFNDEQEYVKDLQQSMYGITTRRAGWDCLRHYEIAANGAVICFKDLDKKPKNCAPHDLEAGVNCISYRNYDDLIKKVNSVTAAEYQKLQTESMKWIQSKSTKKIALDILKELIHPE